MPRKKYGSIEQEAPEFVNFLVNKEDRKYSIGVATKVDWICPSCGHIVKGKSINKVISRHSIPCPICGDGVSKPEKIIASALIQSGIHFESQKMFQWSGLMRYDFYLPDFNAIIEVHGSQHYGFGFVNLSGISLSKQQETDKKKHDLAIQNGIDHYFTIEAIDTSALHIIPRLIIVLKSIGISAVVNIQQCENDAMKSNVAEAARMWNEGMWSGEISKVLRVSNGTVIDYLKDAANAGLCDYSTYEAHIRSQKVASELRRKRVKCITTGEIFDSLTQAAEKYHISSKSNIIRACLNGEKHAGSYNGQPLSWVYA